MLTTLRVITAGPSLLMSTFKGGCFWWPCRSCAIFSAYFLPACVHMFSPAHQPAVPCTAVAKASDVANLTGLANNRLRLARWCAALLPEDATWQPFLLQKISFEQLCETRKQAQETSTAWQQNTEKWTAAALCMEYRHSIVLQLQNYHHQAALQAVNHQMLTRSAYFPGSSSLYSLQPPIKSVKQECCHRRAAPPGSNQASFALRLKSCGAGAAGIGCHLSSGSRMVPNCCNSPMYAPACTTFVCLPGF